MPALASLALALALSAAAPPSEVCPAGETAAVVLGPATATTRASAFLDAADPNAFVTWAELEAIVQERDDVAIEVHFATPIDGDRDPQVRRVRAFAWQAARAGRARALLRVTASDGAAWVAARLASDEGRRRLGQRLGLAVVPAHDDCGQAHLRTSTEAVAERFSSFGQPSYRLPVMVLGTLAWDDPPGVERLRGELRRLGARHRDLVDPPAQAPLPTPGGLSNGMRRPAAGGILIGGPGLPHRFVLMAHDQEDGNLTSLLPLLMRVRSQRPGRLAVQIVAYGTTVGAIRLRHRLCAARLAGKSRAYAEVLGTPADESGRRSADADALLAELDAVPERRCADEPDPEALGLPDGAWLDGLARSRAEVMGTELTLDLLDAGTRPLRIWTGARARAEADPG